jgi:hypothetical protein
MAVGPDEVNPEHREARTAGELRGVRLHALSRLGEMADRGDFDEFLGTKFAYRRYFTEDVEFASNSTLKSSARAG